MSIFRRKKQTDAETESLKSFLDMIAPSIVKFETGYYICGNTFRCIWALREYPILSELYDFIEIEYENFDETKPQLYTRETLQQILLGLHSMCRGADSKFFNGHTNLTSTRFLVFGVKGLLSVAQNVRSTILLNLLSYMSDKLLTEGNTVAALDELYTYSGRKAAAAGACHCAENREWSMVRNYHRSAAENVGIGADAGDAAVTGSAFHAVAPVSAVCAAFRTQPSAYPPEATKPNVAPTCGGCCGNSKRRRSKPAGSFRQKTEPQAARQEKAKVSCAHLGRHICPQCGQFGTFGQGLLRGQKQPCWGRTRR